MFSLNKNNIKNLDGVLGVTSVADLVHFFPDPDPTWYLDMFLMFSKINIF